jgi:VNT family MFS transporter (synaptic vesicle glycoprotein 2)
MSSAATTNNNSTNENKNSNAHYRTVDEFLETAYQSSGGRSTNNIPWRYWCIILSLGVANSSDASEILCISYILSDAAFEEHMMEDKAWKGSLLAAAVFFGMLLGGLFIGSLGDWFGRRPILMLGLMCNSVAGVLSAFAPDVLSLALLRCVAGIGIGTTVPPLFTLATELAPPSQRGLCVVICASFWMVGSVYVALMAMWVFEGMGLSWRVFAMACAIPSAAGAIAVHVLVPESPRFLGLEQRHIEALEVTNSLAIAMGYKRASLLTLTEMKKSFPRSSHPSPRISGVAEYGYCGIVRVALMDFYISSRQLYTDEMRGITWPLQMVWFSLSFGSYGLVTWINTLFVQVHLENLYFNALLFALANLPGNLLAAALMDRIGRSALLISSVLAAAGSLVFFAWFAYTLSPAGIVMSACSFQCFIIAAWNTIDCMSSELFPTKVRSTGLGVCAASGRIGAMVAQFVNGALVEKPVRLLLVASVTLLLGAFTPCLLPSTDMTGQPVHDDVDDGRNHGLATTSFQEHQQLHPKDGVPDATLPSDGQKPFGANAYQQFDIGRSTSNV